MSHEPQPMDDAGAARDLGKRLARKADARMDQKLAEHVAEHHESTDLPERRLMAAGRAWAEGNREQVKAYIADHEARHHESADIHQRQIMEAGREMAERHRQEIQDLIDQHVAEYHQPQASPGLHSIAAKLVEEVTAGVSETVVTLTESIATAKVDQAIAAHEERHHARKPRRSRRDHELARAIDQAVAEALNPPDAQEHAS